MKAVLSWFAATATVLAALPASASPTPREQRIAAVADSLRDKLVAQRRDFHQHPELSNRETRTAAVIAQRLREIGLTDLRTNVAHHGVVAWLKGGKPGPLVAVRADMDALPINETNDVPYKSQTPNVKHACGHDVHATVELGVAEVLNRMRADVPGTIGFIFQPAEEGRPPGEEGGASLMLKEGVFARPPLAVFGLHCSPELAVGAIGFCPGPAQASADTFSITIQGKTAHGAMPQEGVDAIVVAAEAVTALQSIRSRRTDTLEPLVLTIGTIHGGVKNNVLAGEVKLEGTVRTSTETTRARVEQMMAQILDGVTRAHGATYDWKYTRGTPIVVNDPQLTDATLPQIRRLVGETNVIRVPPRMGADDFACYQQVVPGFYYRLGVGNPKKGITAGLHTPDFDVDEDCLVVGTKVMANVLVDFLERNAGKGE